MPTTTTILAGRWSQAVVISQAPKIKSLATQGARFFSWKAVFFESLGREFHALHIQHQERAFMATSHGLNYRAPHSGTAVLH
ncbi:hypothetical protein AAFN88_13480 [Pelagibius sp. CAU 1746]|uniref:hypothetical protein n=1 Tax=Pelagibius sp. CAU 1746 TaxID=3140370 RepID=UPI00325B98E3